MTGPQLVPDPDEIELATFLTWIADRLVNVYGENPQIDFVQTCRRFAEELMPPPGGRDIQMKIMHDEKIVRVEFERLTKWFAMPTPQALQFAFAMLEHCGVKIEYKPAAPGNPV